MGEASNPGPPEVGASGSRNVTSLKDRVRSAFRQGVLDLDCSPDDSPDARHQSEVRDSPSADGPGCI